MSSKNRRTLLDTHPRTILFGLLSVSSLIATVWFAFEDTLLARNERPLTWYARSAYNRHQMVGFSIGAGLLAVAGIAFCHFVLDSNQEPVSGRPCQPTTLEVP